MQKLLKKSKMVFIDQVPPTFSFDHTSTIPRILQEFVAEKADGTKKQFLTFCLFVLLSIKYFVLVKHIKMADFK